MKSWFQFTRAIEAAPGVRDAYAEHNRRQLLRSLVGANVIALVGVPSGVTLDYFLYPARFGEFVLTRVAVVVFLGLVIALLLALRERIGLGWIKLLGIVSVVSMTAAFSLMMYLTDGVESPYFAGVILVLMCWASILPWTVRETLWMCVVSLAIFIWACVANPEFRIPEAIPLLGFSTSFIGITTLVCVGITVFLSRVRFEDFQLRHQLDEKNRELEDLDRLKTRFFSNISHELRTPLTLILGPTEENLARADELDPRVHEGLILIHRNTLRLLKLINDLLDLTRLDQGMEMLRMGTVRLEEFVPGIVDSIRHLGLGKRIKVRLEGSRDFPAVVFDAVRMEKVLVNLLTNAIKYTPAGGLVTVRWGVEDANAWIEVEDTGAGIPASDLPRIFDRFHQVRTNAVNQNQGVGIGLALVKELVERHGGRMEVTSEVGEGSKFRAVVPVAGVNEVAAESGSAEDHNVAVEAVPVDAGGADGAGAGGDDEPFARAFRSADRSWTYEASAGGEGELPVVGSGAETVLVADDEPDMRRYVVSILSPDYRVVQTSHGGDVAALVAEYRPSLVLLDWMMPEKDGLTVCRELRAANSGDEPKIVLLTARMDEKSKIEALRAGANDFLTKPFSSVEIRTRIDGLLRTGRLQRELRERNDELVATLGRLQETESKLIQSEKMNAIGSLSAGLMHEINNPLNYTLTAIAFARRMEGSLSDELKEIIADIEDGMLRIRDVVTDLKTFAYPETPGARTAFALAEAVQLALKIVARELDGIRVSINVPVDLVVEGQRTQLMHVFINLLSNAARAIHDRPTNGVTREDWVSVTAEQVDRSIVVRVADSGPGVPTEISDRIFDAFFTTRPVGSGMGMGLSICHTIIHSHGGTIQVTNDPTAGAVFMLTIPLGEEAALLC